MKEKFEIGKIYYNSIVLNVSKNRSCSVKQLSENKIIRNLQILFYRKKIKQGIYIEKNTLRLIESGKIPTTDITFRCDDDFLKLMDEFISEHNAGIIIKKVK